jgi:hypothetical protein
MAMSVYVALIADASSSYTSAGNALHGKLESRADCSPARQFQSRVAPSRWSCQKLPRSVDAPSRRSKRVKRFVIDGGSVVALLCGGPLSTVDFDSVEWEILYPRFVEGGLVDPPDRAHE